MTDDIRPGIEVVILAAGGSSRLGQPKQLVKYKGRSLLRHAARNALATGLPVHVVLGAGAVEIRRQLDSLPVDIVVNDAWRDGIAGSIVTGCNAVPSVATAVLLILCDQPLVTDMHLDQLIRRFESGAKPIVATRYGDVLGVPAVFDARYLPALRALSGDSGAQALIRQNLPDVDEIVFEPAALDIDKPADVQNLARMENPAGTT